MTGERNMKRSTVTSLMPVMDANRKSIVTDSTAKEAMSESGGLLLDHKMSHHHSPQIQVVDQSVEQHNEQEVEEETASLTRAKSPKRYTGRPVV